MVSALHQAADDERAAALRQRLMQIELFGVRITLPLGLVALPAFALMTVVPAALASLRSVG